MISSPFLFPCCRAPIKKQAMLVRQLEEELRMRSMQNPSHEIRQQVEAMYAENEHLSREVAILRETVKVSAIIITPKEKPQK